MKKWILKAVVQKAISFLPQREKINYLFQKYVTKGVLLTDEHFEVKLISARDHIGYFNRYSSGRTGSAEILELGTGWYPIVPLSLYLTGESRITSVDAQSWLTKDSFILTIEKFIEWNNRGKFTSLLPGIITEKWNSLLHLYQMREQFSLSEMSEKLHFDFIVGDARNLHITDSIFDFICSNNTFEHIPEEILYDILKEFKRVLKKGGIMSHFIDMSDHFAHFDKTINIYNFLKFSDFQWKIIDNAIQPQNRLRLNDYKEMYRELDIDITEETHRKGDMKALNGIKLHKKYLSCLPADLAISHAYLISKVL